MDCKEPRFIREIRDGVGVRRGLICSEVGVMNWAKNTDLRDKRSHHMAGGACGIVPKLEVTVFMIRP